MKYDIYTEIKNNVKCYATKDDIDVMFNGIDFDLGHSRNDTEFSFDRRSIFKTYNDMSFEFYSDKFCFKINIVDKNNNSRIVNNTVNLYLSCTYDEESFSKMQCYFKKDDGVDFFKIKKDGDKYILESKHYDNEAKENIDKFFCSWNDDYHGYSKTASSYGIIPDRYVSREIEYKDVLTTINSLILKPEEICDSLFEVKEEKKEENVDKENVESKEPNYKKKLKFLKWRTKITN